MNALIVILLIGILIAEFSYLGQRSRLRVGPYLIIVFLWSAMALHVAFNALTKKKR